MGGTGHVGKSLGSNNGNLLDSLVAICRLLPTDFEWETILENIRSRKAVALGKRRLLRCLTEVEDRGQSHFCRLRHENGTILVSGSPKCHSFVSQLVIARCGTLCQAPSNMEGVAFCGVGRAGCPLGQQSFVG